MKNQPSKNPTSVLTSLETPAKLPYLKPTLLVHGSVKILTKGNGGTRIDGNGQPTKNNPSDQRIKENIVKVGDHPLGIGLYLFDYIPLYRETCGHGRQFGVMADEVEIVMPEAVSEHPNGFKQVNYAILGISRNAH